MEGEQENSVPHFSKPLESVGMSQHKPLLCAALFASLRPLRFHCYFMLGGRVGAAGEGQNCVKILPFFLPSFGGGSWRLLETWRP